MKSSINRSSDGVADGIYNANWTEGTPEFRKSIKLVILRAHKPQALTTLKFSKVSLSSFTTVSSSARQFERDISKKHWLLFLDSQYIVFILHITQHHVPSRKLKNILQLIINQITFKHFQQIKTNNYTLLKDTHEDV